MGSISKGELIAALESYPDDAEVIFNMHHNYPISEESGRRGWIAYINGIRYEEGINEIYLMN